MLKIDGGVSTPKPFTPKTEAANNPVVVDRGGAADNASKVGAHQFVGVMIQFKVQSQQINPPTIDDDIKRLRALMRHLPPEDQQAIQQEIKGLELTRMASDPAQVDKKANEIINSHGGRDHFDYEAAGRELAEMAKLSPQAGRAVMDSVLSKIKQDDRDEIAQSFTESLTDAELSKLAKDPAGKALLETVKSRLLEGKVHDDEQRTAERLDMALKSATNTLDQQIEASAQRVREAWDNGDAEGAATALALEIERLNALYGPDAGGKLVAKMFEDDPEEFTNMLRFAGSLPASQQSTVGIAMGQAFDKMSAEDKQSFAKMIAQTTVADAFTPHIDGTQPTRLAELVAKSFSSDFKRAVVGEMMKEAEKIKPGLFGDNGGVDVKALFNSAAIIAESAPKNLQVELFGNIVKTLPKVNLPSLTSDPQLKDRLSKLFIDNGPDIIRANAPDGAYIDEQFMNGMVKFFELTLFSKNGGKLRQDLMKSVITTLQEAGDAVKDAPPLSQSAYERAHGGYSQQDHVEAMGGLAAFVWQAAKNQKDTIQKDQKAREETAKLFIGMAFAFVPGSKDVIGEVALEGGDFLGKLADKAINYTWEKGKGMLESNAQNLINNQLRALNDGAALKNIDKILDAMRGTMVTINAAMPNGEEGELDLRSKFQAAFAFYNLLLQK